MLLTMEINLRSRASWRWHPMQITAPYLQGGKWWPHKVSALQNFHVKHCPLGFVYTLASFTVVTNVRFTAQTLRGSIYYQFTHNFHFVINNY